MMKSEKNCEERPERDVLIDHIKTLFIKETNNESEYTKKPNNENTKKFDILNTIISEDEVKNGIKNLKSRKSPGFDRISNEMIKSTDSHGIKLLTMLFSKILKSGVFLHDWNYSLIRLIQKGNDIYDPINYRGITLNSCMGKSFWTILYNPLASLLKDVYCKEQEGFRQNHRTTDHIFLLRTIINETIHRTIDHIFLLRTIINETNHKTIDHIFLLRTIINETIHRTIDHIFLLRTIINETNHKTIDHIFLLRTIINETIHRTIDHIFLLRTIINETNHKTIDHIFLLRTIINETNHRTIDHIFLLRAIINETNHRTIDHIFLLRTIIKKYTQQNKILFSCFVDFTKAFDSIWRSGLINKLHNIGIDGLFLQIIKSIYNTTTNSLIYKGSLFFIYAFLSRDDDNPSRVS